MQPRHYPEITFPPMVQPQQAPLMAMLFQLHTTQWMSPDNLRRQQLRQANVLLNHAARQSRFWAGRLGGITRWEDVPLLSRADIQRAGEGLFCRSYPKSHGQTYTLSTSGSTGQPVVVRGTDVTRFFFSALAIREHLWHKTDFKGSYAVSRMFNTPVKEGHVSSSWGPPVNELYKTGPCAMINITDDIEKQAKRIVQFNPSYLLTYPSTLKGLLEYFNQHNVRPSALRGIRTIGELLQPETRRICSSVLGLKVIDAYSSQEVGYIALQCPDTDNYHVQGENLLVEVIDENGRPCQPGQTGRVVITALHNFATPIIRYVIGDYAVVAERCSCGRGLPALKRIMGRQRNLLTSPDGSKKYFPKVGFKRFGEAGDIKQYQVIQQTLGELDVRLVVGAPLLADQEKTLRGIILEALGYEYKLNFIYIDKMETKAGKFEEVKSNLA